MDHQEAGESDYIRCLDCGHGVAETKSVSSKTWPFPIIITLAYRPGSQCGSLLSAKWTYPSSVFRDWKNDHKVSLGTHRSWILAKIHLTSTIPTLIRGPQGCLGSPKFIINSEPVSRTPSKGKDLIFFPLPQWTGILINGYRSL